MAFEAPVYSNSDYPTIEEYVGNTPLVRLQRLSSNSSNVILAKLEGNNPAGSVKDRCALVCPPDPGFLLSSSPWQMPVQF
jgi:threonine dehydratase